MITTTVSTCPSLTKFSDFVQLKDYRQPTKDEYVRYVRKLGEHYQCDPARLTEDQLRAYFLFLRQEKQFGGSAMKLARCSLRSFFRDCLHVTGWTVFEEVRVSPPQTLPLVLAREQVAALLGAVQQPRYRAALGLIYGTGLRVGGPMSGGLPSVLILSLRYAGRQDSIDGFLLGRICRSARAALQSGKGRCLRALG